MSKVSKGSPGATRKHLLAMSISRFKSGFDLLTSMERIVECVEELKKAEDRLHELESISQDDMSQGYMLKIREQRVAVQQWKEWMYAESKMLNDKYEKGHYPTKFRIERGMS